MLISALSAVSQLVTYSSSTSSSGGDAAGAAFGFVFMMIYCCILFVPFLIWAGVSYWVYTDAQKNNVENAILWPILTFFFGLIGLVLYLVVGKAPKK